MISLQVWLSIFFFFARVNTLLDEHAPNHELSKKGISLKAKPWINKSIQALMRERDRLSKRYCNENNPTHITILASLVAIDIVVVEM